MPALALSRVGARVVESGPDGQELAAGAWQKLEELPDPRSPRGRIYPLACLVAVALCAFTAAGNDRLTAVGQWISRASQADLARLRAPWDPMAGRYRAPDEKTIRVLLDRLDPRALARALLGQANSAVHLGDLHTAVPAAAEATRLAASQRALGLSEKGEPTDDEIRAAFKAMDAAASQAFARYVSIQIELRQVLTRGEFDKLSKVR